MNIISTDQEKYYFPNMCILCRYARFFAGPVTNIWAECKVRGRLPLINPEPKGKELIRVNQWQTSNNWGRGSYICQIHYSSYGSYDILYYGDIILLWFMVYLQQNNLYLCFVLLYWLIKLGRSKIEYIHGVTYDQWIQISELSSLTGRTVYTFIDVHMPYPPL